MNTSMFNPRITRGRVVTTFCIFSTPFFPLRFLRKRSIPLGYSFPHFPGQNLEKMLLPRWFVYQKVKCLCFRSQANSERLSDVWAYYESKLAAINRKLIENNVYLSWYTWSQRNSNGYTHIVGVGQYDYTIAKTAPTCGLVVNWWWRPLTTINMRHIWFFTNPHVTFCDGLHII